MNKCGFIGRMGKDPKFFPGQGQGQGAKKAFMTFSLAVKRPGGQKGQDGKPLTDWLDFIAFGKTAELLNQYCPTGSIVAIADCVATKETYQDKNTGQNRTNIKFSVNEIDLEVTFAASKDNNAQNGNNGGGNQNYSQPNTQGYNQPNQNYNQPNNQGYNNNQNYNNQGYNNNAQQFNQGRGAAPVAPAVPQYQPGADEGGLPF